MLTGIECARSRTLFYLPIEFLPQVGRRDQLSKFLKADNEPYFILMTSLTTLQPVVDLPDWSSVPVSRFHFINYYGNHLNVRANYFEWFHH